MELSVFEKFCINNLSKNRYKNITLDKSLINQDLFILKYL